MYVHCFQVGVWLTTFVGSAPVPALPTRPYLTATKKSCVILCRQLSLIFHETSGWRHFGLTRHHFGLSSKGAVNMKCSVISAATVGIALLLCVSQAQTVDAWPGPGCGYPQVWKPTPHHPPVIKPTPHHPPVVLPGYQRTDNFGPGCYSPYPYGPAIDSHRDDNYYHYPAPRYAAIAYSTTTGAYGYSFNRSTRFGAERSALEYCGASDAEIMVWCRNNWCALAVGDAPSAYGWGYASSAARAKQIALDQCRRRTSECRIAVCVFSGN